MVRYLAFAGAPVTVVAMPLPGVAAEANARSKSPSW
jgi:hypothetical protein